MIDISVTDLLAIIGRQTVEIEALKIQIQRLEAQLRQAQKNGQEMKPGREVEIARRE